jgi:hypothetical protein
MSMGRGHFGLYTLEALAFIHLRRGEKAITQRCLDKISEVGTMETVGGAVIAALAAGLGRAPWVLTFEEGSLVRGALAAAWDAKSDRAEISGVSARLGTSEVAGPESNNGAVHDAAPGSRAALCACSTRSVRSAPALAVPFTASINCFSENGLGKKAKSSP